MPRYLSIQEAPVTDSITADGHVGAQLPWPVVADEDGKVYTPSSMIGMHHVHGFQNDLAVQQVDVRWEEVFADPSKAIGKYLVVSYKDGSLCSHLTAVDSAVFLELDKPLPVD